MAQSSDKYRPNRKFRHLEKKLEQKLAQSRKPGAKARRWKKWLATYRPLVESGRGGDDS